VTGLLSWWLGQHIRSPADLFFTIFTPTVITPSLFIGHFQSVRGGLNLQLTT